MKFQQGCLLTGFPLQQVKHFPCRRISGLLGPGLVPVTHGLGLQSGDVNRDPAGPPVVAGFPRLSWGEIGVPDLQGLMPPAMVVMVPELRKQRGQPVQGFRGMGVKEPGQGAMAAFVLSLGLRVAELARDGLAASGGNVSVSPTMP